MGSHRPAGLLQADEADRGAPLRGSRWRLRSARREDLADLVQLERLAFTGDYAPHRFSRDQFRYYLRHPRALLAVATRGGALVGYVCGLLSEGVRTGQVRLYSIAVRPAERRRGLGRALLGWFLEASAAAGAHTAILEVLRSRRGTREFFRDAGFRRTEVLPDHYGEGTDGVRMRRQIVESDPQRAI